MSPAPLTPRPLTSRTVRSMPHAPSSLSVSFGLSVPLGLVAAGALALLAGCVPALTVDDEDAKTIKRGESRTVELRYLRLDAKGFKQTLKKAELKSRFPERILRETWLLDMPIEPLIKNALTILVDTPETEALTLPQPAFNMWSLLRMTPANTDLAGTSLEGLLGVGEAVGLPHSTVLSNLIGVDANTRIIGLDLTLPAILKNVVAPHPNTQMRRAPVGSRCPIEGEITKTGMCAVAPGSMPVSLWDVVTDFEDLPTTFGPAGYADPQLPPHPGFVKSASPIVAATSAFEMTVRVNLNALPYKGVDLTDGTVASVNSTESQVADAFDFSNENWMEIKGLVDDLVIDEMVMAIYENDAFIPSGDAKDPMPRGNSPVWDLPTWQFERLIADVAYARSAQIPPHCDVYAPEGMVEMPFEAVDVCMGDNGDDADGAEPDAWVTLAVDDSVKLDTPLPAPSYFWDVLLEVAQKRLHDSYPSGTPLPEGAGDVEFALRDIPAGISTATLEKTIRDNIKKNPAALAAIAELLNENTDGAADFYYYRASLAAPLEQRGDWLFFVAPDDIKGDTQGDPERPYGAYPDPGFFADEDLTQRLSTKDPLDGDTVHEKVRIATGDVLYAQDADESVFRIEVGPKPDRHIVSLTIERIR